MKKYTIIIILALITQFVSAQNYPKTFNYQAIARNNDGTPIAQKEIIVEVTILKGDDCDENGSCNVVWQELHSPVTNDIGLFSVNIGSGQNTFAGSESDFLNINWNNFSDGNYFLQLRVDFNSSEYGNGLIDMGIVKFQSVPYSFSAAEATDLHRTADGKLPFGLDALANIDVSTLENNQVLAWNGTNWANTTVSSGGGVVSLQELTDVSLNSSAENDFLKFDGTNWTNSKVALANISDINISSPTNGQAIVWNGTAWTNQDLATGGGSVWTQTGSNISYATGKVGIGTATPSKLFHVVTTANQGVLVSGELDASGNVGDIGNGTMLYFVPSKSAFRVGTVYDSQWNNNNVGEFSTAFGKNAIAKGQISFAAGSDNKVFGTGATAFGSSNEASGGSAFVTGFGNKAKGVNSFVSGESNEGANNVIVGGTLNKASGANSFAVGQSNNVFSSNSIAFGESGVLMGQSSIVGGKTCSVSGNYSMALGEGCVSNQIGVLCLGKYNSIANLNNTWTANQPIFIVGDGIDDGDRSNSLIITMDGNINAQGILTPSVDPENSKTGRIKNNLDILKINSNYSKTKDRIRYGFNPNDVKKYFPDLITDFEGGKVVNYIEFVPIMLETVKEQQNTITNLEKENQELKNRLSDIEQRLSALEN